MFNMKFFSSLLVIIGIVCLITFVAANIGRQMGFKQGFSRCAVSEEFVVR